MRIRAAQPDDLDAVHAINAQVVQETTISFSTEVKSRQAFAEVMKAKRLFVAAAPAGDILGYASFFPFRSGSGYAHVAEYSIALASQAQGKGIGRALMNHLELSALEQGIDILIGGVSSSNDTGRAFHVALGFQPVGHLPGVGRKFGETLDLYLYQKTLSRKTAVPQDQEISQ